MIARIWHGWTSPQNADLYEGLLKSEIFPGIVARKIAGFRRIELLRAAAGDDVEFVTVMWFDSMEAIEAFAGADYETAVVPPKAQPCSSGRSASTAPRSAPADCSLPGAR